MLNRLLVSAAVSCLLAATAMGQATLRTPLKPGTELRYTVTVDQHYTNTYMPPDKPPTERTTWQQAIAKLTVKDAAADKVTIELVYEGYHFRLTPQSGEVIDVDAAGPAPEGGVADQNRKAFYDLAMALTSTKITLVCKPDGTIDKVEGVEELMKNNAARLARRFIEMDGIKAMFGPVLALRDGDATSAPNDKWTSNWTVLADRMRETVPENRTLAAIADGKATLKGDVRHFGKTANVGAGGIYLRDCLGSATYSWETAANTLASAKIEDNITFVMMNPDSSKNEMNTVTTTMIQPTATAPKGAAPAATSTPAGAGGSSEKK